MSGKIKFAVHGEWEQEPDEEEFVWAELPCLIKRHPNLGHLCGYVGVPPAHPHYAPKMRDKNTFMRKDLVIDGKVVVAGRPDLPERLIDISYEDIDIGVHGGLTFGEIGKGEHGWQEGFHWYGFDCAHSGDYGPYIDERSLAIHRNVTGRDGPASYETYKNWEYVKDETKHLAEQLAVMMQPPSYEEWRGK